MPAGLDLQLNNDLFHVARVQLDPTQTERRRHGRVCVAGGCHDRERDRCCLAGGHGFRCNSCRFCGNATGARRRRGADSHEASSTAPSTNRTRDRSRILSPLTLVPTGVESASLYRNCPACTGDDATTASRATCIYEANQRTRTGADHHSSRSLPVLNYYRLKPVGWGKSWLRTKVLRSRFSNSEIVATVVGFSTFLLADVFLDHLIRHIAARCHEVPACPK